MKNKRCFFLGLVLLLTAALLPADDNDNEEGEIVRVTGIVRLVGSGTLPQLVITGTRVQWYITRDEMYKLFDMQQQAVTVEARETVREMIFANGRPAGTWRELSDIRIIEVPAE